MLIKVVNWSKYNPRSDVKHTSWFRMENSFWRDPTLTGLDAEGKLVWFFLLATCSENQKDLVEIDVNFAKKALNISRSRFLFALNFLQHYGKIEFESYPAVRERSATGRDGTGRDGTKEKYRGPVEPPHDAPLLEPEILDLPKADEPPPAAETNQKPKATRAGGPVMKFTEWDMRTAKGIQQAVLLWNPAARKVKRANLDKWANEMRLMRERDNLDEETIETALRALFSEDDPLFIPDPFWRINVQSASGLAKHWDKISAAINNPKQTKDGGFKL